MLFDAIEFAARAHRDQFRKGTRVPSLFHACAVAQTLIEYNCAAEVSVAALLHDTVEDTGVTVAQVRAAFGDRVAALVAALSEPDRTEPWETRKARTLETLKTAPLEIVLIQCADKLDNIRSIRQDLARVGDAVWARFKRGREQQRWYYQALVAVFEQRLTEEPGRALFQEFRAEVEIVFGKSSA